MGCPVLRGERAGVAVADGAVAADEVGFRGAIDAKVGDEGAVRVAQVQAVGVAACCQHGGGVGDFVFVIRRPVDADDGDLRGAFDEVGVFDAAGGAPAAPDVDEVGRVLRQVGMGVAAAVVKSGQVEGG